MSIRDEIRAVEEEIERLRAEAATAREQLNDIGPTDAVDRAQLITMAEQQEALAEELGIRRENLLEKLGEKKPVESQEP